MDLTKFDQKHVRATDIWGETFIGFASHCNQAFLTHEYGGDEDGVIIGNFLLYNSQIAAMEEIEVHGTAELRTERLTLRRYTPEDAETLFQSFGTDPEASRYSGWNPYATPEKAKETVRRFIKSYDDERFYGWAMDVDGVLMGTIGAYDYADDQIEVGFSVKRSWQGRGYATAALQKVLEYLTENEGIATVTAWCAAENEASRKVLEKAGMRHIRTEKDGLTVGEKTYDKLIYAYQNV